MDQAFAHGTILRTHVLRPTWHFVLPADIRWMLELTAPRVHALNAYQYRQLELDDAVLEKCNALIIAALRGGNQLTRKELWTHLESTGIATGGFRLSYLLMNVELRGLICSGGLDGKQHTYALLDERAPQANGLSHDEALSELTLRYFTGHGPATANDFRAWSSLTAADVKKGLAMVASQLENEHIEGLHYWFGTETPAMRAASPTFHLLQAYDEYIMGYKESRFLLDLSGTAGSLPPSGSTFNHIIILDGQVAGRWKRTLGKDSVVIDAALYAPLDDAQTKALEAAADRYRAFLGLSTSVVRTAI
jgi:hypothetical protein